ncbi:Uncharacterised protein [Enterobacter hormaechei]|uniref:hypothetical protein n=1 Tax=Enterobacter hormaechei TaxID=158836 RepID=UPI000798633E|nr:hypothetical protein [Enterobacter hormaechei]CZU80258.1 Uncharacterised protein [Enterobacter hormaechei]CZV29704.1 Uncharacterised protein [Enterobacter hormaechei]CZW58104.1 Uncharacterised protein [Enterobacter hormaechei]CZX89035.1 Uncharacterised protein [Enterobacter hormaechei]SAB47441.1 Uncharacterised protein [Enterobacter hormaechei]
MTFTKEQLQQIIETDHVQCGEASSLARIALASLEAEPVAWLLSGGGAKNNVSFDSGNAYADPLREVTPLYTAPPAPVSVPDAMDGQGGVCCEVSYADGWNSCRAAMLQGAEPVTTDYKLPEGWVAVPIEPTSEMQSAAAGAIRFDTTPINKLWTGNAVYRAMIAAAPRQEVK